MERLWDDGFDGLLPEVAPWVKKSIARKLKTQGKLVLVSAVCPDYEHDGHSFTYRAVSGGVPYIAKQHLRIAHMLHERLAKEGVPLEYHVTLADTEFDLPSVMKKMAQGDPERFLSLCESSCEAIKTDARALGLPLASCRRFTEAFPAWLPTYHEIRDAVWTESETISSVAMDIGSTVAKRWPLYAAMSADPVDEAYCKEMAIRQLAQYAVWGRLAEDTFGNGIVMMNHSTPNLGRVNHLLARKGKERIPILQLALSTVPLAL